MNRTQQSVIIENATFGTVTFTASPREGYTAIKQVQANGQPLTCFTTRPAKEAGVVIVEFSTKWTRPDGTKSPGIKIPQATLGLIERARQMAAGEVVDGSPQARALEAAMNKRCTKCGCSVAAGASFTTFPNVCDDCA